MEYWTSTERAARRGRAAMRPSPPRTGIATGTATGMAGARRLRRRAVGLLAGSGLALLAQSPLARQLPAPPQPPRVSGRSAASALPTRGVATQSLSARDLQAAQVLRQALLNPAQQMFSGEQTLLRFDQDSGAACVTQETHLGATRYRIDYLNPPNARGRIQFADGKWCQLYLPQAKTVVLQPLTLAPLTSQRATEQVIRLQQRYHLHLESGLEDLDGRPAYRLDITPRANDRPHQHLWIDRATGLILRRETYSPTGAQTAVSFWRNLHFLHSTPQTPLRWSPPPGVRLDACAAEKGTLRLSEARLLANRWALVPSTLGEGFVFESARRVDAKGAQGLCCEYSDGLNIISLVQIDGACALSDSGSTQNLHRVRFGSEMAQVAARGAMTVLSWERSPRPVTMSLVAEMPAPALLAIARSLR